jgi:hypothetical protein
MKRISVAAMAVIAVLLLAGCGITAGTVVEKEHQERRIYPTLVGKVVVMHVDDEDWILHLQDGNDTGAVEVSRETFDSVRVGDRFGEEDPK